MASTMSSGHWSQATGPVDHKMNGHGTMGNRSAPQDVDLTVVMPDGHACYITVPASTHMLDLLVQVCASARLSPAKHTIHLVEDPRTATRDTCYKASQTIGSLEVSTIWLAAKPTPKSTTDEEKARHKKKGSKPFVVTQRLTVSLPQSRKAIVRVSPQTPLNEIFQSICADKGLSPWQHELRHPQHSSELLDGASNLMSYGISEIAIVYVPNGSESYPCNTPTNCSSTDDLPSSSPPPAEFADHRDHCDLYNTMPRLRHDALPPADPEPFMPGTEKKRKSGFFSFFKKKGGKFKLNKPNGEFTSTQSLNYTSARAPTHAPARVRPTSVYVAPTAQQPGGEYSSSGGVVHKSQSLRVAPNSAAAIPDKPPRKKRPAPPPPLPSTPPPPLHEVNGIVEVAEAITSSDAGVHSRTSSHSSGFDESSHLLESPTSSPGERTTMAAPVAPPIAPPVAAEDDAPSSTSTLQRKKRRAPRRPDEVNEVVASVAEVALSEPPPEDSTRDELQAAVVEELRNESSVVPSPIVGCGSESQRPDPVLYFPPPPPGTPPPKVGETGVVDSYTQVRSSLKGSQDSRSSIHSYSSCEDDSSVFSPAVSTDGKRYSDVSEFVDKMTELTNAHDEDQVVPHATDIDLVSKVVVDDSVERRTKEQSFVVEEISMSVHQHDARNVDPATGKRDSVEASKMKSTVHVRPDLLPDDGKMQNVEREEEWKTETWTEGSKIQNVPREEEWKTETWTEESNIQTSPKKEEWRIETWTEESKIQTASKEKEEEEWKTETWTEKSKIQTSPKEEEWKTETWTEESKIQTAPKEEEWKTETWTEESKIQIAPKEEKWKTETWTEESKIQTSPNEEEWKTETWTEESKIQTSPKEEEWKTETWTEEIKKQTAPREEEWKTETWTEENKIQTVPKEEEWKTEIWTEENKIQTVPKEEEWKTETWTEESTILQNKPSEENNKAATLTKKHIKAEVTASVPKKKIIPYEEDRTTETCSKEHRYEPKIETKVMHKSSERDLSSSSMSSSTTKENDKGHERMVSRKSRSEWRDESSTPLVNDKKTDVEIEAITKELNSADVKSQQQSAKEPADASLFKVPSVPRSQKREPPRVNSLREAYRRSSSSSSTSIESPSAALPPVTNNSTTFWGPRPWGARNKSEPSVKDIRTALSVSTSPALVVEAESASETAPAAVAAAPVVEPSSKDTQESQSSPQTNAATEALITSMNQLSAVLARAGFRNPTPQSPASPTPSTPTKKSLQAQYAELQEQFSQWQQQLIDNQAAIAAKQADRYASSENLHTAAPPARMSASLSVGDISRVGCTPSSKSSKQQRAGLTLVTKPDNVTGRLVQPSTPPSRGSLSSAGGVSQPATPQSGSFSPPAVEELMSAKAQLRQKSPGANDITTSIRFNAARPSGGKKATPPSGKSRPRFEPELDPREQLMIAIRNASGRNTLRKVAVTETNW